MKKIIVVATMLISTLGCAQKEETSFKSESLEYVLKTTEDKPIAFQEILKKHEGKTIFIEVWASWCSDCIKALPEVKKLNETYGKEVVFVNLSCDKTYEKWLEGINKYQVEGDNYLIPDGMKGNFGKSLNVDWIPRFLIVDKTGNIVLYRAIEKDFDTIREVLNKVK